MTYKESITYYTSVTLIDGEWRAHCYVEIHDPDGDGEEYDTDTLNCESIYGPADALIKMADLIEEWESKNVEPYKSCK